MVVFIAIDDEKGLMFNQRRQSRDRVLRDDVLVECNGEKLWMNSYSRKLFGSETDGQFEVDEDFLNKAADGEFCYVETDGLAEYENKISKLVLYRWNRLYPADVYFEIDLSSWTLASTTEFAGSSHERITKEVWVHEV